MRGFEHFSLLREAAPADLESVIGSTPTAYARRCASR
jgi:hypothetical protein